MNIKAYILLTKRAGNMEKHHDDIPKGSALSGLEKRAWSSFSLFASRHQRLIRAIYLSVCKIRSSQRSISHRLADPQVTRLVSIFLHFQHHQSRKLFQLQVYHFLLSLMCLFENQCKQYGCDNPSPNPNPIFRMFHLLGNLNI